MGFKKSSQNLEGAELYPYLGTSPMNKNSHPAWFALYTRSRCERVVLQQLHGRSLRALLPEYTGKNGVRRPLFPGYVFVQVSPVQRRLAVQIHSVVHMVHSAGEPAEIPEDQLRPYLMAEAMNIPLHPWPFLKSGTRVRVNGGPLKGMEGIIDRRCGASRLVLNIDLFLRAASVEISADYVETLDSRQGPSVDIQASLYGSGR